MKVLFMETHYPGFFRFLIPAVTKTLSVISGNDELYVISRYTNPDKHVPTAKYVQVTLPPVNPKLSYPQQLVINNQNYMETYTLAMKNLKESDFSPDIVIATEACLGRASEIFPDATIICYFEYYHNNSADVELAKHSNLSSDYKSRHYLYNPYQLHSLVSSHIAVVPSEPQKKTFPTLFQDKIIPLPMGIDTAFFSTPTVDSEKLELSEPIKKNVAQEELLVWSAQNPDLYFGFELACRALQKILKERPKCSFVLITPQVELTKKNPLFMELLEEYPHRISLVKECVNSDYRALLHASAAYIHYSVATSLPFSLLEAMSCGALVLTSDAHPINAFLKDGTNALLGDFSDTESLANFVIQALSMTEKAKTPIKNNARQSVLERYSTQTLLEKHVKLILASQKVKKNRKSSLLTPNF